MAKRKSNATKRTSRRTRTGSRRARRKPAGAGTARRRSNAAGRRERRRTGATRPTERGRPRASRTRPAGKRRGGRGWVRRVAETSNAMDLPPGIFTWSPRAIARGLKQAVLRSPRTKGSKFRSAMSMLNLYINRSGRNLSPADRRRLEAAKDELRRVFGRPPRGARPGRAAAGRARPARRQAA